MRDQARRDRVTPEQARLDLATQRRVMPHRVSRDRVVLGQATQARATPDRATPVQATLAPLTLLPLLPRQSTQLSDLAMVGLSTRTDVP